MILDPQTLATWTAILLLTISSFVLGSGWRNNSAAIEVLTKRIYNLEQVVNPPEAIKVPQR